MSDIDTPTVAGMNKPLPDEAGPLVRMMIA